MSELTNPTQAQQSVQLQRNFFSNPIVTAGYPETKVVPLSRDSTGGSEFSAPNFDNRMKTVPSPQPNKLPPSHQTGQQPVERARTEPITPQAGLYDVFAPAGPIGIVVDTTKNGPAVHSLKRTSPMLGLINPGDLIVGLDDEDTRGMTAATLTRLMARKSSQKERKITLLTSDTY